MKKKVEDKNTKAVQDEPTFTKWDYGDLYLVCSHCGHKETVEKGVKDGLQFVLPTTDEHKVKLVCSNCGVSLTLAFDESGEETKKEAEEKYEKYIQEQKDLQKKKQEVDEKADKIEEESDDAPLQEDIDEESV